MRTTRSFRKIHYIIRGALDRAVRWRHLGVNKAAMAKAPSPQRTEPDPPNAEEAAALLSAAWSDPEWGLLLWLTMITGPRRGEVPALRWRRIDFQREIVWLHRSDSQRQRPASAQGASAYGGGSAGSEPAGGHQIRLFRTNGERITAALR